VTQDHPSGPDLAQGVAYTELAGGKLLGHVGDRDVLLVRADREIFAIDAQCTHYHGPLADGLVVGETIRCPLHHACFNLRNGEAVHAPAIAPLTAWRVEQTEGRIFVRDKLPSELPVRRADPNAPRHIVIVGGGAAGYAAAEMLRRMGFGGEIVMLSSDADPPIDRPNLSKDYLAGSAPEEWMPLQPDNFYKDADIDLRLMTGVVSIDTRSQHVVTANGFEVAYDRLLLATGAEPVRLNVAGAQQPNVFTLRTMADCRAIIQAAMGARRAVVVGASFIGLEVAASLRARNIEVHVVAPEKRPMERILGPDMGDFIRTLHEKHGVVFHLENTVTAVAGNRVELENGETLDADLVVAGIGVRPRLSLAEQASLAMDRGVLVNEYLQTSVPNIFAAGDIARWPDPHSGQNIRVEHWVVAERQGQCAALNMLNQRRKFDAVPFFWTQHYDVPINYIGHAEQWDEIVVEGVISAKDCLLKYCQKGRTLAVASIFRDLASLEIEAGMEGADGVMPASLIVDADQHFFASGLEGVDVVVHGRNSREFLPHSPTRRRVILTRNTASIAIDPSNRMELFWNPTGAPFEQALDELGAPNRSIAVLGGPSVFELFLDVTDVFYLSRVNRVRIPGGRPIFPDVPLRVPEAVLADRGLDNPRQELSDAAKGLTITAWRRDAI